ncbi:MAG: pyridoxal-phosphate dependent enzyme, partial [Paenibacillaceae bacterium]|nr:pyridoxal-phosphate dependent enzyme [Paenibacillaceae bacterium]
MSTTVPDQHGRFGIFGGRYVPETLMNALFELEEAYRHYSKQPDFIEEVGTLLRQYSGRPTPLYYAQRLSEQLGGAKIYLKREDLNHTGAHKINNAIGQAVLALS